MEGQLEPLRTVFDCEGPGRNVLCTDELRRIYGGTLVLGEPPPNRPYVLHNVVATMDGVTSYSIPGKEAGGYISGFLTQDAAVMGMLRAAADAILVGAKTLRLEREHVWTPQFVFPPLRDEYAKMRRELKKRSYPMTVFVTASGDLGVSGSEPVFSNEENIPWVVTSQEAKSRVRHIPSEHVLAFGQSGKVDLSSLLRYLREILDVRTVLVESGPGFTGSVFDAELYDEHFRVVSPYVIGSGINGERPGIDVGFARDPEHAIMHRLISAKVFNSYVFLRYQHSTDSHA